MSVYGNAFVVVKTVERNIIVKPHEAPTKNLRTFPSSSRREKGEKHLLPYRVNARDRSVSENVIFLVCFPRVKTLRPSEAVSSRVGLVFCAHKKRCRKAPYGARVTGTTRGDPVTQSRATSENGRGGGAVKGDAVYVCTVAAAAKHRRKLVG